MIFSFFWSFLHFRAEFSINFQWNKKRSGMNPVGLCLRTKNRKVHENVEKIKIPE